MIASEATRQVDALDQFVAAAHHRDRIYGAQWGLPEETPQLARARDEFLLPALNSDSTVVEIGCGGGRWSRCFPQRVRKAFLVDATPAAEVAVRALCDWEGFEFVLSGDGRLPAIGRASIDYAFSFDTFVHFHRELFDASVQEIARILRPGGLFHLHHARRWPESDIDDRVFQYREDEDISSLLASASFRLTNRTVEYRGGCGSILREAVRLLH